jgi:hypothetical protein
MKTLLVASALLLSLVSCTSTFVPYAGDPEVVLQSGSQDPGLDSVIHQGGDAANAPKKEKSRTSVLFLIGGRSFEESDWDPVEDQVFIGSEWSFMPARSILGFEAGFGFSFKQSDLVVGGTTFTFTGNTFEVYLGPRLEVGLWETPIRIYAGAGPSFINAGYKGEVGSLELSESDNSLGLYAHAGLLLELGSVYLGVDVRGLTGTEITLFNFEMDADYTQVAGVIGFRF